MILLYSDGDANFEQASRTGIHQETTEIVIEGSFMVDTGILSNNIKFPSHEYLMTFCNLTIYNDNPSMARLYTKLWYRIRPSTES